MTKMLHESQNIKKKKKTMEFKWEYMAMADHI